MLAIKRTEYEKIVHSMKLPLESKENALMYTIRMIGTDLQCIVVEKKRTSALLI